MSDIRTPMADKDTQHVKRTIEELSRKMSTPISRLRVADARPVPRTWVFLALLATLALAQGCGVSALDENPACPVMACPIGPTIANVRNNGVLHSGFLI